MTYVDTVKTYQDDLEQYCNELEKENEFLKIVREGQGNKIIQLNQVLDKACQLLEKSSKENIKEINIMITTGIVTIKTKYMTKEELIKALNYDRKQYEKGYKDAMYEVKHPNPVKYEEMKKGMYLWDASTDYVFKVDDYFMILIDGIEGVNNRFYPVYTPNSK